MHDRQKVISTLVHEVAHRDGRDGTAAHRQSMEKLFGRIIAANVK